MNTVMDVSTSSSELELPEVEPRFIPFTSTPLDAQTDEVDDSTIQEKSCCDCALIKASQNIADLTIKNKSLVGEESVCSELCVEFCDPLAVFIEALCDQISVENVYTAANMPSIKFKLCEIFSRILDKTDEAEG